MEAAHNWKAVAIAACSVAAAGFYLSRMIIRMNDNSGEDGASDGGLLTDMAIIAGLLLLTIYETKTALLPLLLP